MAIKKVRSVTLAEWKPTKRQIKLVNEVVKSGRLTYGMYHRELEAKFAHKHGFKYCIFTNSGTAALQVAWHFLKEFYGWSDGAEVIVPSVTFVATVNMLLVNRLKPVLVDVRSDTFNIDPLLIEENISSNTVAICPVDLLGRPVDIIPIKKLAKKHLLVIVEDSCETMFVNHSYGHPVGSHADIAVYSSYLAHIISTGVGGFLCTNNKKWADDMRSMIWHGRDNYYLSIDDNEKNKKMLLETRFRFNRVGYSSRLTELEAAIGVDEIDRSQEIIEKRTINAVMLYELLFLFDEEIQLPEPTTDNAWMFFPILCKEHVNRDKLALFLERKGIQTRWIMPLTNQPVYKGLWNERDYPVADMINKKGILLGCHHFLKDRDIRYVFRCFKEYFHDKSK